MIRILIFDWGDTVMRVFPGYAGPMADWPEVAAVPGVEAALATLAPHHLLALATNAADSGAALVRAALQRVGLARYFALVFTARELAARKPQPAFFEALLRELGCAAGEVVMIGDDYAADVAGAKAAGLRGVWFNPAAAACPDPHPLYDAVLSTMAELPAALANIRLPDLAESLALLAEGDVSPELLAHCRAVAAVAFRLAGRLQAAGETVDPLLAHRGGLLHDIAKVSAKRTGQLHDELAAALLRARGFAELADIAACHTVWAAAAGARRPVTWEQKLVYYADRLLEEDRLVGVEARMAGMIERHPDQAEALRGYLPATLAVEAHIAGRLGMSPVALIEWLRAEVAGGG